MATAVVTIICIALIVMGGMTLSQGILTSSDSAALSVDAMSVREGEIMRTNIAVYRAAELSWGDDLRITVKNDGQTKLASFDKWDVIVNYTDGIGNIHSSWLPYITATEPGNNEWTRVKLGLDGPYEYFEPGILNPGEEMTILAHLNPMPGNATSGDVSITTPNGVFDAIKLVNPGYVRLTPQSEKTNLGGTKYYQIAEGSTADGAELTASVQFASEETGRKLLYNINDVSKPASFVYPLTGISDIPSGNWTVNYRCKVSGGGAFPQSDSDTGVNIDVLVRRADGSLRTTLSSNAAPVHIAQSDAGGWVTLTGSFTFPGYAVIDSNDYLEIDFYGQTDMGPSGDAGTIQISIDDNSLPITDQTRIEVLG